MGNVLVVTEHMKGEFQHQNLELLTEFFVSKAMTTLIRKPMLVLR